MTSPPNDAFPLDVPEPPTLVERLLALADLYTRHNDTIDILLMGSRPIPEPAAYAATARRLERETHTAVQAVRSQQLRANNVLANTVIRLKQLAYLSGGAARHLTAVQHALRAADTEHERPDPIT